MTVEGRKKKGSRKTKKGWRTLTDTTDVEAFLEDKRLEERLGTPFKERRNEDLFVIDTSATPSKKSQPPVKSKKSRRKALLQKPPRCFQALVPDSAVPDPLKKRNRVRSKEERKHPLLVQREERRKLLGIKTAKELDQERNRKYDQERRNKKPKRGEVVADLWNNDDKIGLRESEWLNPVTKQHVIKHSKEFRKTVPKTLRKKSSVLPAVEVPHPGVSYNPTFDDHQELLQQVATKEKELLKKEEHLTRVTAPMRRLMDRKACEAMKIAERSEGAPLLDPAAAIKDEPSDDDETRIDDKTGLVKINPTTSRDKKKDLKKRRNIREERLKQALNRLKKSEKKKATDLSRLKAIEEEVGLEKQKAEEAKKKREEIIKARAGRTKRLGKNKFAPLEADFVLPSQMTSGLRRLAPQGSILADRFNSLQKRNVMEVSARQKLRKARKQKIFKKAEHKMPWEAHNYKAPKRSAPRETKADWEF